MAVVSLTSVGNVFRLFTEFKTDSLSETVRYHLQTLIIVARVMTVVKEVRNDCLVYRTRTRTKIRTMTVLNDRRRLGFPSGIKTHQVWHELLFRALLVSVTRENVLSQIRPYSTDHFREV